MIALLLTPSLKATDTVIQVDSCRDETLFIPTSTLSFIGTFLETRELFILARWHKNPNVKDAILRASGDESKLMFYEEIERYNANKKKLSKEQILLYPKFFFVVVCVG